MFRVLILHAEPEKQHVVLDDQASSVFLPGADGEFEVLDFHKPIISHLKDGSIVVDNSKEIKIRGGVVKLSGQSLIALVEL